MVWQMSQKLIQDQDDSAILIICGGSHGRFAIEDFLSWVPNLGTTKI